MDGSRFFSVGGVLVMFALAVGIMGCPITGGTDGETKALVMLSGDSSAKVFTKAGPVEPEEIESLVLTVTQIVLDGPVGSDDDEGESEGEGEDDGDDDGDDEGEDDGDDEGEDDAEGEDDGDDEGEDDADDEGEDDAEGEDDGDDEGEDDAEGEGEDDGDDEGEGEEQTSKQSQGQTVVFEGSLRVDLFDLRGVSEVISNADVEPGTYTKVRLSIEDPVLVLKDSEEEITDIQLTANGRLFVSQQFEVPEGQTSIILLDFADLQLVEQGNGGFTLTPQLRVDLDVLDADVQVTGTISAVDSEAGTITVIIPDGSELTVDVSSAAVYLASDEGEATGSTADLTANQPVEVSGTLNADGSVTAAEVRILPGE